MDLQTVWLAHFRAVVAAEIASAKGRAAEGYRRVASATGLGSDYVYQIYTGKPAHKPKRPSANAMNALHKAYGTGKTVGWFNQSMEVASLSGVKVQHPLPTDPALINRTTTIERAVYVLGAALGGADSLARRQALLVFEELTRHPEQSEQLARRLTSTLGPFSGN